jgi:hypothetical protein
MSNEKTKLQSTLERLAKMAAQNTGGGSKVKYWEPKQGKNNLIVLPTVETGDPFLEWGEHKSLQVPSWKSVPCAKFNKGEECLVCSIIADLQAQNWKGNFNTWKPIELKVRYFSPVVDLDDLEKGLQWWGYGKTVLTQFQTWLLNLEEDETEFYNISSPSKVIVNYDKDAEPTLKYKLDKKDLKHLPEGLDLAKVQEEIKSLNDLMGNYYKKDEELTELIENYIKNIQEGLAEEEEDDENKQESETSPSKEEEAKPKVTKLDGLKTKKGKD